MPFFNDWVREAAADFANQPPAVALLERNAVATATLPLVTNDNAPVLLQLYVDRLNAGDYQIVFTFDDLLVLQHTP